MSNLLNLWREVCGRSVAISTNRRAFSGEDIALLSSEIEKALADAVNSGIGIVRVAPASMLAAAPTPAAQRAGQEAVAQSFGMTRAGLIKTYPMVEMGFGEVCVGDGYVEDIPALTFSPQEFQPIGTQTVYEPLKEIPVAEVLCAITFANVESLDVVMRTLADVRKKFDAAPVNGGERAIVDAAIAWADGKPDSMKACAALVNAVAVYRGERAADAQQVGGGALAGWRFEYRADDDAWVVTMPSGDSWTTFGKNPAGQLVAALSSPAKVGGEYGDAYQGAREDLAIWKKRALEAEELNRKFIAEVNGPTHMGEPAKVGGDAREAFKTWKRTIPPCHAEEMVFLRQGFTAGWDLGRAALSADGGDRKDAERYRWAIEFEDNAETLHSVVICHAGDIEKINERVDSYVDAAGTAKGDAK